MKILFVTEQFPWPLHDGANLRTYHMIRGLAEKHEVHLLGHRSQDGDRESVSSLKQICEVTTVPRPRWTQRLSPRLLWQGLSHRSLFLLKNWSEPLLREADRLLDRLSIDAIHFNQMDTVCYCLARDWPQRKIFDTHNNLSDLIRRSSQTSKGLLRKLVFSREARRLRNIEQQLCLKTDATLVCSDADAQSFASLVDRDTIHVVPNGVDTGHFRGSDVGEDAGSIVFTGCMGYFPNEEGVTYFAKEILPLIRNEQPSCHFQIVGRGPSVRVQQLGEDTAIEVTGSVPDVRNYLARAQVVAVPLLTGSGTRLKILEAFAMGKAVVSTSLGAEGIPARHGEQILLADDPEEFAHQILRLMSSSELRDRLGREAKQFVRQRYDWRAVHKTLLDVYEKVS